MLIYVIFEYKNGAMNYEHKYSVNTCSMSVTYLRIDFAHQWKHIPARIKRAGIACLHETKSRTSSSAKWFYVFLSFFLSFLFFSFLFFSFFLSFSLFLSLWEVSNQRTRQVSPTKYDFTPKKMQTKHTNQTSLVFLRFFLIFHTFSLDFHRFPSFFMGFLWLFTGFPMIFLQQNHPWPDQGTGPCIPAGRPGAAPGGRAGREGLEIQLIGFCGKKIRKIPCSSWEILAGVRFSDFPFFVNPLKDLRDLRFFSTEIQGFEDVTRFYGALMGSKNGFDGI